MSASDTDELMAPPARRMAPVGAYGANMDRLRRIKTPYDPDNFFWLDPNIPPA